MSPEKVEAIALASLVSLAFAVPLSSSALIFDRASIVLLLWGVIGGLILSHSEIRRVRFSAYLAIIPAAVLCLAPTTMAVLRSLLAAASGVVPDRQNFLGYSVFNPQWWLVNPMRVSLVLAVLFLVCVALLTLCCVAGGRVLIHLEAAYRAGPEAFERVEKIAKRVIAVLALVGAYVFVK